MVHRGLPYKLSSHDPVRIGSAPGVEIFIEGADPHHAELQWDYDSDSWMVVDDPAPGETILNGVPTTRKLLRNGDTVSIAGLRILFRDNELVECPTSVRGMRVSVAHVSAGRPAPWWNPNEESEEKWLDDISFTVSEGEFVALLGPSGCGKSTLLQRIAGFAHYEGSIRLNGRDLRKDGDKVRPLLAYLPQNVENTLHDEFSVMEEVEDFSQVHLAVGVDAEKMRRCLAEVGLQDEIDKKVGKLSGGQKRRLALVLALLRDPSLLLLDEPTAGLDPSAEKHIMELLRTIAEQGRTVICATHVLGSLSLCDRVVLLAPGANGGTAVFSGTPEMAERHFETVKWDVIFDRLNSGEILSRPSAGGQTSSESELELPKTAARASFAVSTLSYLKRLAKELLLPSRFYMFVLNPVVMAVVLMIATAKEFKEGHLENTIFFCMSVAMFWTGLSGSVRNLVTVRTPVRCLERMRGVSSASFFLAQIGFLTLSAFVQSALFIFPVFLISVCNGKHLPASLLWPYWIALSLVGCMGAFVGLLVSALSKKEIQAVWALPFVAVLALFISKPVIEDGSTGQEKRFIVKVERNLMPTYIPQTLLEHKFLAEKGRLPANKEYHDWCNMCVLFLGYGIVFLSLAFLIEEKREKDWDGR